MGVNAEVKDVIDLFIEHRFRQAKRRYLAEHEAAAFVLFVEQMDLVAERRQVASDRQACRPGADERDLLAVRLEWTLRHQVLYFFFVVSGNAFEAANGHGFFVDASAAAGRLARTVTCSA